MFSTTANAMKPPGFVCLRALDALLNRFGAPRGVVNISISNCDEQVSSSFTVQSLFLLFVGQMWIQ